VALWWHGVMVLLCYAGMVIRTTVVIPDALHEELRLEAFHSRLSMATIIRMRLERRPAAGPAGGGGGAVQDPILAIAGLATGAAPGRGELLTENLDADLYGG
jgi:hypothetical protein